MKGMEGLLNALLNSTVFGVFLYQGDGKIVLSNKTFRDFIGYSEEELRNIHAYDIIADEYKHAVKELVERRLKGEVFSAEQINHIHKTKDGFLKPTVIFAYTVSYLGKPAGLVLVLDTYKQKMYENLFLSLKEINHLIISARNEDALLDGICRILVKKGGFRMVAAGEINKESKLFEYRYVCSSYGETIDDLRKIKISADENLPEGRGSIGEAYRTGNIVIISDSRTDPRLEPWRQEYLKRNIFSTCAIPISKNKITEYVILIQSQNPESLNNEYAPVLREIQSDLSFALMHLDQGEKIKAVQTLYAVLSDINQIIVRAKDENSLFYDICNKIIEKGLFIDAFVCLFDENLDIKSSYSYNKSNYFDFVKLHLKSPIEKQGPLMTSFLKSKIVINNGTLKNPKMLPWRDEQIKRGYLSSAAIPVIRKNKTIGVFSLYADKQKFFKKDAYDLLREIMMDINFALDKMEDEKWHSIISIALNSGSDFIVVTDKYFNMLYVNESVHKILGYLQNELVGEHYSKIFEGGSGKKGTAEKFLGTILSGEILTDVFTYKAKNENIVYCLITITPFKIGSEIEYYITVAKDITSEIKSEETIERLINFDTLTGLQNKKMLKEKIDAFILESAFTGNKPCAFAIINPVNFSFINHTLGFETGNKIMIEIANRIKHNIKRYDILAKWESDKFAVFLKNLKFNEDAMQIIDRIFSTLEKPYIFNDKRLYLSFNAGISFYPKDSEKSEEIFNKAESALLNIKTEGDRKIGFFKKELEEYARKKVELRNGLKEAIVNKEFILHYQPYFDTQTGLIIGAEALLRWKKSDKIVLPMEFIPFLEQSGLITEVENWILDEVALKIKSWAHKGLKIVPVSINISPVSFRNPHIKEKISDMLDKSELEPRFLNFEVVERTLIEDIEYSKLLLSYLKQKGFGLSIDDFGTGYSSLSYLANFPFDFLKIDISFIRNMLVDKHSRDLVEVIIYLSKKLNMKSIAEGVETQEQLELLKNLGCDCIQGFLFSKPLDEESFEKLLGN